MKCQKADYRRASTVPCSQKRVFGGVEFPCWHRYEPGHRWSDEPHQHWFTMLDDHGKKATVTWIMPEDGSSEQPLPTDGVDR